ncbi:helix-turn-helix domain-containing protein [Nocardioides convexus]|uniref:helix-turn-helix domain-containing protein n=1 Tax=Nocardioides convexus TaxID=2712224 RepID=UPI0024187FF8|nr:helix-turn-helix domain-containing protein [Nocardioides convexus]
MANQRATGRPRDPRIEAEACAAVRALLTEGGYAAVTGSAVATRAGTTKAALYRRWPALPHLVHEAVFPGESRPRPEPRRGPADRPRRRRPRRP